MVDISGTIKTEIRCKPDMERLLALNITVKDLEDAIKDRDISLETLSIANGICYNRIVGILLNECAISRN